MIGSWIKMKKDLPDIRVGHEGETLLYKGELLQIEGLHKEQSYPDENYMIFKNRHWPEFIHNCIRFRSDFFEFANPYIITINKTP